MANLPVLPVLGFGCGPLRSAPPGRVLDHHGAILPRLIRAATYLFNVRGGTCFVPPLTLVSVTLFHVEHSGEDDALSSHYAPLRIDDHTGVRPFDSGFSADVIREYHLHGRETDRIPIHGCDRGWRCPGDSKRRVAVEAWRRE